MQSRSEISFSSSYPQSQTYWNLCPFGNAYLAYDCFFYYKLEELSSLMIVLLQTRRTVFVNAVTLSQFYLINFVIWDACLLNIFEHLQKRIHLYIGLTFSSALLLHWMCLDVFITCFSVTFTFLLLNYSSHES